jgi:SAM-dependent methyltransferase
VRETLERRICSGDTVLEIGCGPGSLLAELAREHPETEFVGIDIDPQMIEHARDHHQGANIRFEVVDLSRKRVVDDAAFAYSIDVLHHIRALPLFLPGVHASLRADGKWLAIEPNVFHPYIYWSQERMRRSGVDEDHFRPWKVEPLLQAAGFTIVERRYAFLFPGWLERVPRFLAWLEPLLERFRFLGGSVVYRLERR